MPETGDHGVREAWAMGWAKKTAALLLVVLCWGASGAGAPASAPASAPAVLFSRGDALWRTDLQGSSPEQVGPGYDGEISPGGDRGAFTDCDEGGRRYIAVRDLESREIWRVPGIEGENSYGPRWSPDGTTLLFSHWWEEGSRWVIATIRPDGTEGRTFSGAVSGDLFSPFWGAGGTEIFAQDLTFLYRFDREGRLLDRRPVEEVVGDRGISSATRFSVAPDGKTWLFDALATTSRDRALAAKVGDAVSAAFVYAEATKEVRRISPPGVAVSGASWAPGGRVLLAGFEEKDVRKGKEGPQIAFRLLLLSGDRVIGLAEDALAPSCALK